MIGELASGSPCSHQRLLASSTPRPTAFLLGTTQYYTTVRPTERLTDGEHRQKALVCVSVARLVYAPRTAAGPYPRAFLCPATAYGSTEKVLVIVVCGVYKKKKSGSLLMHPDGMRGETSIWNTYLPLPSATSMETNLHEATPSFAAACGHGPLLLEAWPWWTSQRARCAGPPSPPILHWE